MERRKDELSDVSVGKLLFQYALPAIIATTASSLYNIIDRIFIGHGVGALAISGLALTFPIMNLAVAFGTLVGAGAGAVVSIRMGQQRHNEAIRTLGNAFTLNIIIGGLFSIFGLIFLDDLLLLFGASSDTLPYAKDFMEIILAGNMITHLFFGLNSILRSSGHPTKAMISVLLTVGINVILAPIFIFWFKWGIRGAATATVTAQTVGLIWVLAHFINKKHYIHFQKSGFRLSGKIMMDIFSIGMSPFAIHVMASLVTAIFNRQLAIFGGDLAIGAFGIINSVSSLIVMIVLGLTQGMQPIVGYNYGAKNMERVIKTLKLTILWATGVSFLGFIVAQIFPTQIASAFTDHKEMISIVARGMRINLAAFAVVGFQMVASNFFQAIGLAKTAIFLSLSRQALFLIPLILILPHFFQLDGVWASSPIADLIATITTAGVLIYYNRKIKKGEAIKSI